MVQPIADETIHHVASIDSLRGLAALSVFFFHMLSLYLPEADIYRPWFFVFAGHEAVILFFVLSGFVLTLSNESVHITYQQYTIRRIFRLYPAYYLSMLLSIVLFLLIKPMPLNQYTPWFNTHFSNIQLSYTMLLKTLLLFTNEFNNINGVIWSLVYEVTISILILPLIWRLNTNRSLVIVMLFYAIFFVQRQFIHPSYVLIDKTIYFSVFFYMGNLVFRFRKKMVFLDSPIFIPLYILCYSSVYFSFGHGIFDKATIRDLLTGLGAVGFLCLVLYNRQIKQILDNKIIHFYGKISYSFYLLHIPIMYGVIYMYNGYVPLIIIMVIIFIITTISSALSYYLIEKKFIRLGRALT